jgi:predicted acylesterase/phospholipase RssA
VFRRPLGVFLQGGGVLGAWQIGALAALTRAGLEFSSVMGYSIGVVNGSALAFGRLDEALERWQALSGGVMRPRPRLFPPSLCCSTPLYGLFEPMRDEALARAALKCDFTIMTACPAARATVNARFTPQGRDGWDGPMIDHLAASCAIPWMFPPIDVDFRGRRVRLVDGGVPMPAPPDFTPLASCADVLVLEMGRADEVAQFAWTPWTSFDRGARRAGRRIVDRGVTGLLAGDEPPRVYRLSPSRRLKPLMLDFRAKVAVPMLAQGRHDARAFLAAPEMWRAS